MFSARIVCTIRSVLDRLCIVTVRIFYRLRLIYANNFGRSIAHAEFPQIGHGHPYAEQDTILSNSHEVTIDTLATYEKFQTPGPGSPL